MLDILRNAIVMELEGKDFFERAVLAVRDQRTKDTFSGLVKQEQRHIDVLGAELARFEKGQGWGSLDEVSAEASSYPKLSVFKDRKIRAIKLSPDAGELEALKIGIEVERKSIEYYSTAGTSAKNSKAKELFAWLVGEESGHLTILDAEYAYRVKSGYYYDDAEFSLEVM